jgi:hypothetical protein
VGALECNCEGQRGAGCRVRGTDVTPKGIVDLYGVFFWGSVSSGDCKLSTRRALVLR